MAHNTPWSKKEERIIINNKDLSLNELCKLLPHRTKTAVSHRRNYLGLGKSVYTRPWTAKEDSILKNNLELSLEKLQKMLPNRNKKTIMKRAWRFGKRYRKNISEDFKSKLITLSKTKALKDIYEYFPDIPKRTIKNRFQRLGLKSVNTNPAPWPVGMEKIYDKKLNQDKDLTTIRCSAGNRNETIVISCKKGHLEKVKIGYFYSQRKTKTKAQYKCLKCSSLEYLRPDIYELVDFKNNEKLDLKKLTPHSRKLVNFVCKENKEHKFKRKIYLINRLDDSFCPFCRKRYGRKELIQIVKSLIDALPHLTDQQKFVFFQQSGLLRKQQKFKNIARAIIANKFPLNELTKFTKDQESIVDEFLEDDTLSSENIKIDEKGDDTSIIQHDEKVNTFFKFKEEKNSEPNPTFPKIKSKQFLKSIDKTSNLLQSDKEAVDYLLVSGVDILWQDVFLREKIAVKEIQKFKGGTYVTEIRNRFLTEYEQAKNLIIPEEYKSHKPLLMQRLTAIRVKNHKRVGNFSGTGAGKTISAILSAKITNSKFVIIACPNAVVDNWENNILECFPKTSVLKKTFKEDFLEKKGQKYLILNFEYFQLASSSRNIKKILKSGKIDMIIIDEIHYSKQRTSENMSKRREMLKNLIVEAGNFNKQLKVIGMSATPVINTLYEGRTMIELITGKSYADLDTKPNIPNCMKIYQILKTIGTRQMPHYDVKLIEKEPIEINATQYLEEIKEKVGKYNILQLEQILTKARLPVILKNLKPPTLIYTHLVEGVVKMIADAVEERGLRVGSYTGEDKSGYQQFLDGNIDVLIGSSAIGTGVDQLQKVCNQLILNILPWTNAEYEQLKGRIYRQGQKQNVEVLIPATYIEFDGEKKSWCLDKLERIKFKKTLADAAVDGIVPEETLRSELQVFEDLRNWIKRLSNDQNIDFEREKLSSNLFVNDEEIQEKRLKKYGDFSLLNNKWNRSDSKKTHSRLQNNKEEWFHYHELYRTSRKTWLKTPYKEMIKYYSKRHGLKIGDFGCGEALIEKELGNIHTIYSFDHIAINNKVTIADLSAIPLEDACLDVVIFSLSLMGNNFSEYIREASRVLKLDGTIRIIESSNRFTDLSNFSRSLKDFGFDDIIIKEMWKFTEIKAFRSERACKENINIKF